MSLLPKLRQSVRVKENLKKQNNDQDIPEKEPVAKLPAAPKRRRAMTTGTTPHPPLKKRPAVVTDSETHTEDPLIPQSPALPASSGSAQGETFQPNHTSPLLLCQAPASPLSELRLKQHSYGTRESNELHPATKAGLRRRTAEEVAAEAALIRDTKARVAAARAEEGAQKKQRGEEAATSTALLFDQMLREEVNEQEYLASLTMTGYELSKPQPAEEHSRRTPSPAADSNDDLYAPLNVQNLASEHLTLQDDEFIQPDSEHSPEPTSGADSEDHGSAFEFSKDDEPIGSEDGSPEPQDPRPVVGGSVT